MIFSHPRLFNFSVSHQTLLLASGCFQTFQFHNAGNHRMTKGETCSSIVQGILKAHMMAWESKIIRSAHTSETEDMYSHFAERRKKALRGDGGLGVGMGWGVGWALGWGRFSRQPSSPPCPLGPACQTQNCLKTSASSTKGAILISFENRSNYMQFPCSTDKLNSIDFMQLNRILLFC